MAARRKQEEKHLQTLKKIQQLECNKKCFECEQRGPTYVDVTIGSFVCTSCGGILRGLNPPHRVKSVSMATFTSSEIAFIETRGNEYCKNIYLGKYEDRCRAKPESRNDHSKLKAFMEQKYEQKRWYVPPEEAQKPLNSFVDAAKKANEIKPLSSLLGQNHTPIKLETKAPKESTSSMPIDNILGDFNSSGSLVPATPKTTVESGFADFGNAFSSSAATNTSLDVFGDFTAGHQTNVQNPSSFGSTSTMNMAVPTASNTPSSSASADKYADLADLFSSGAQSTSSDFGWSSLTTASTANSQFTSMGSVFGSPAASKSHTSSQLGMPQSSYGNMSHSVQPHTASFGIATASFGAPQQNVFGNVQQPAYATASGMSGFGSAPAFGMGQNVVYGTTQHSPMYGGAMQTSMPQGMSGLMGNNPQTTATQNPSNPFMQSAGQSVPFSQPTAGSNPFMTQQTPAFAAQSGHNVYASQSSATNPFMAATSKPAPVSTNPFF